MLEVDGVRLHCVERGAGSPVVLLHGNTVSHRDFEASGLIDRLARHHRVIAFDRPGFGHSSRPRDRLWTPRAQGALFKAALAQMGVERPVVLGHSMGSMVAMAIGLDDPAGVRGLVLIGGYYYPSLRVDALLTAPAALPVLGDVMRYTVTALSARLLLERLVETMFMPNDVPAAFWDVLSREMLVRPVQIRANAEDAAFMIGQAKASSERHGELRVPVAIIAGTDDVVVDVEAHSVHLHEELQNSSLVVLPGAGHMVHYVAPEAVVAAVNTLQPDGMPMSASSDSIPATNEAPAELQAIGLAV
ncbi:alpha/beta fold hydrolase [Piscinibacter koreensis]|nr:alpha/beta hydrolase [Schlegelella koreensis]